MGADMGSSYRGSDYFRFPMPIANFAFADALLVLETFSPEEAKLLRERWSDVEIPKDYELQEMKRHQKGQP